MCHCALRQALSNQVVLLGLVTCGQQVGSASFQVSGHRSPEHGSRHGHDFLVLAGNGQRQLRSTSLTEEKEENKKAIAKPDDVPMSKTGKQLVPIIVLSNYPGHYSPNGRQGNQKTNLCLHVGDGLMFKNWCSPRFSLTKMYECNPSLLGPSD